MRRYLLLISPLLLIALAACSQPDVKPPSPSLTITPNVAEAQIGGAAVSFTATLEDATDDVAWTLVPEVGTLSSFTGFETSYTPPASAVTDTTVILTASAGDLSTFASINLVGKVVRVNPETGLDSNDGSADAPVKTIRRALTLAEAGTTVYLAGGTYSEGSGETFMEAADSKHGYLVPAGVKVTADPSNSGAPVVIRNYGADRDAFRFVGDGELGSLRLEGFNRGIAATTGTQLVKDVTMLAIRDTAVTLEGDADLTCTNCNISVAAGMAYFLDDDANLSVDGASSINSLSPSSGSAVIAIYLAEDSDAQAVVNLAGGASHGMHGVRGGKLTLQDADVRLHNSIGNQIWVEAGGDLKMFGGRVSGGYLFDGGNNMSALTSSGTVSINGTIFEDNPAGSLWFEGGSADIRNAVFRNIGDADTVFHGMGLNAITVYARTDLKMRDTQIQNVTAASNASPPISGTHGVGIYVVNAEGDIDLGTVAEPGRNHFHDCGFTCLEVSSGAGTRTVQAAGNSWIPNEQDADGDGQYGPQLIDAGSWGRNFYVTPPSSLQF